MPPPATLTPSPRPADAEGVKDLIVLASYGETQFKIRLEEKFQGRPLAATIVRPFVKAFNKKGKSNTSNVYKQRLEVETLERLEIEGVAVDDLSAAASSWLPRDGMRATLYFPAAARPLGAPKPALEQPEGEPYTELVKRVKMSVEQIATAEDLAWSSKTLRPQDMVAFAALAKEYAPLNVVNLYAYDNWIDDEALEALCPCFKLMPKLTSLHLHNNEITSRGCEFLADNPPVGRLKQLSLWRNHIDGKGFDALGGAIGRGTLMLGMLVIHYNKPCLPSKDRLQDECDGKGVVLSMS